jgi:hypothetical protein
MSSSTKNASAHNSNSGAAREAVSSPAETTLRLIATLPAPVGIEDRVMAGVQAAPRSGRVLHWPEVLQPTGSWMRGAAAAAIVFVVAGGGWGIYTRVQPTQPARVIAMPPRTGAAGGFSNAGAMRTPQTLNGPVVGQPTTDKSVTAQPGNAQPVLAQPAQVNAMKKAPARIAAMKHRQALADAGGKASVQPAVSSAK